MRTARPARTPCRVLSLMPKLWEQAIEEQRAWRREQEAAEEAARRACARRARLRVVPSGR